MSPLSDPFLHTAPLQVFEDCFEPLVFLSRNIIIHYEFCSHDQVTKLGKWLNVISVCGCESPIMFRKYLQSMIPPSMQKLTGILVHIDKKYWRSIINHIINRLQQLADVSHVGALELIDYKSPHIPDLKVKCFKTVIPNGPCLEDDQVIVNYLCCKSAKYAQVWIEVILETIDQLELLYVFLHKSANNTPDQSVETEGNAKGNISKVKTNLTVPQIGVMFYLLVKSRQLIIPDRFISALIRWIVNNFQSKNAENITFSSMRNNFFTLDAMALDFWENLLENWLQMIRKEREHLAQ